jgi:hypothetical protein
MDAFVDGLHRPEMSVALQEGPLARLPDLPTIDAESTARYLQAVIAGGAEVPAPIAQQVECLLALRRTVAARVLPQMPPVHFGAQFSRGQTM